MWPSGYRGLAVLVAGGVYFALGAVWYGLLAKPWMRLAKKSEADVQQGGGARTYLTAFASSLLCAAALQWFLLSTEADTLLQFLAVGAGAAIGLVISGAAKHYAFLGHPRGLLLIDGGYDLVGFLAMSAIFWRWSY